MLTRRNFLWGLMAAPLAVTTLARQATAAEPPVFQNPIAINGTDPVAYFTQGAPVAGSPSHRLSWKGAEWHFANAENAALFRKSPDRYAPVFGGYCAYAASRGYLAPTKPEAWTVYEGKLYLNANLRARKLWLRDVPGNIAAGHTNWPAILG